MQSDLEQLTSFLVDTKLISAGDIEAAKELATTRKISLREALINEGKISEDDFQWLSRSCEILQLHAAIYAQKSEKAVPNRPKLFSVDILLKRFLVKNQERREVRCERLWSSCWTD